MKKILICVFCILFFVSCAKDTINLNIPLVDISAAVNKVLSNADKLSSIDTSLLVGIADLNVDIIEDYVIMMQTKGTEIDQYGLFKVKEENVAELKKTLETYIEILNKNQADFNYLPTETIKLKEAEVFVNGTYVFYSIMSAEDKIAFINTYNDVIQ